MSLFSAFVVFIIIWWMVLFVVLPFGIRGQHEDDDVVPGSEPGAPQNSQIKRKFLITTGISIVLFIIVFCIIHFRLIDITR